MDVKFWLQNEKVPRCTNYISYEWCIVYYEETSITRKKTHIETHRRNIQDVLRTFARTSLRCVLFLEKSLYYKK